MSTTRVSRHLRAPRSRVYAALIDPEAIARWKVPNAMTSEVHEFDGESFRISLTYDSPDGVGKSGAHTDTYRGRFTELVPDERVVEVDVFDADGGTDLSAVHEGLPEGVAPEDNETGWRESLDRLATLVESDAYGL
jgi:uncharacterized protein YndB with AHSA1/START domain